MTKEHQDILKHEYMLMFAMNAVLNGFFVVLFNLKAVSTGIAMSNILFDGMLTGLILCSLITLLAPIAIRKKVSAGELPSIPLAEIGWIGKLPYNPWALAGTMGGLGIAAGGIFYLLIAMAGVPTVSVAAYVVLKMIFAVILALACAHIGLVRAFATS